MKSQFQEIKKTLMISPNKNLNVNESFELITTKNDIRANDDDDGDDEIELGAIYKIKKKLSPPEVEN